jgi:subtilisin family serine protease
MALLALLALLAFGASALASASEFQPGEIIVKYKDGVTRGRVAMDATYGSLAVKKVKRFQGIMKGFEQLTLGDNIKVQDAIAELLKSGTVEYAQPNYILRAYPIYKHVTDGGIPGLPGGAPGGGGSVPCIPGVQIPGCDPNAQLPCIIPGVLPPGCSASNDPGQPTTPPSQPTDPNQPADPSQPPATKPALNPAPADVNPPVADPDLAKVYGMSKIGAIDAWKTWNGDKSFIVADIDTGIDYNHEDLAFNIWRNPTVDPTLKDTIGYDFIHNDGLPFDDNEHGTHTAGTIGAVGGNGIGVSGVIQRVSLMSLKFLSGDGSGTTADAIRAIDYATAHGAKVLSNSWGGKGDDDNKALQDAISRAGAKGVLFVAAAGNDGTDNDGNDPSFPASFNNDNMISVAATDETDGMAFFSNYGAKTTQLGAPGVNVYSTTPGNKYEQLSGTSMACPHVAGAAALLWSKHPDWDYKKVKQVLMDTVDKLPSLEGKTVTGGRLNVLTALRSME